MMHRRFGLGFTIPLFMTLLGPMAFAAEPPPNVVLIVADDLGWADLGCYGSKFYRTPNLDRLAGEGRRFTQAYAACPVCSPTRAALMTGKSPARLLLTDWLPGRPDNPFQKLNRPAFRQELPLEEVTIAEALKTAGYTTGHIGKWHLGGDGFGPTQQGFDLNIAGDASGSPLSYFAPFARNGRTMPGLTDAPAGQYLTDRLTDEAERFLNENRDHPFFLYMPHYAVHTPMSAKPELVASYPNWDGTPRGRQENPIYAAMLESLDQSVGRILAKLDALEVSARTIVVFTSDNGGLATREGPNTPATNNSPIREGKGWLYEGGIRVPLIVRWPGKIASGTESTPVWSGDLFPTVLALCGQDRSVKVDGVNLKGSLTERTPLAPRTLFWHYPHYSNQGGWPGGAVRDGDWKLLVNYATNRGELFHLGRDPRESNNVAESEPAKVRELTEKLAKWRENVHAQMPTPNAGYVPNPPDATGAIVLPARSAEVQGVMLRYEPLPHKNALGYWVRADDWAFWEFTAKSSGVFTVEALIGCGSGSGGSRVEFQVGSEVLTHQVVETGGFQNFVKRDLGAITIDKPGRYRLEVRARAKQGPAVMDLREVRLVPERKS
jgi:arylsulfatase A